MTHPNPHRGEVAFRIGKETYLCRPTMDTLAKLDHAVEGGLMGFTQRVIEVRITYMETITALSVVLAEHDVPKEELGRALEAEGMTYYLKPLGEFAMYGIKGRPKNAHGAGGGTTPARRKGKRRHGRGSTSGSGERSPAGD